MALNPVEPVCFLAKSKNLCFQFGSLISTSESGYGYPFKQYHHASVHEWAGVMKIIYSHICLVIHIGSINNLANIVLRIWAGHTGWHQTFTHWGWKFLWPSRWACMSFLAWCGNVWKLWILLFLMKFFFQGTPPSKALMAETYNHSAKPDNRVCSLLWHAIAVLPATASFMLSAPNV